MPKDRILIIKLSSLGDVLASTPAFRELKGNFNANVDHLVMEHCGVVTENNPHVNKLFLMPFIAGAVDAIFSLRIYLLYFSLLFRRYDCIFLFHRSKFLKIFTLMLFPKECYCYDGFAASFFSDTIKFNPNINRTYQEWMLINKSQYKYEYLEKLDYHICNATDMCRLTTFSSTGYFSVNVGGGNLHASADTRCWPVDYYAEFLNSIGKPVILLGYGLQDEIRVSNLVDFLNIPYINLVSQLTFDETALVIKNSIGYMGNDSSLIFLAAALGKKSLAFYGPTSPSSALPAGFKGEFLVGFAPCSPCYSPFDGTQGKMYACKDNICMKSITVLSAVKRFRLCFGDYVD